MVTLTQPFSTLTANELMSRDVVMIPQQMSLRAAARMLSQHQISGAPVVDAEGRCVGVVSATDFVHWAEKEEATGQAHPCPTLFTSSWQMMETEDIPTNEVANYMTLDPVTVSPSTPIGKLAQLMLDAHIHRVIVVDQQGHPIGIVSSMDILAAVAHADHRL